MSEPIPDTVPLGIRRQRRKTLSDAMVAALPKKAKRYFHPDPELPMHGVRVMPSGLRAFYVVLRDLWDKQRWIKIGGTAEMTIEQSREKARDVIKRVKEGKTPFEPPPVKPQSVEDVVTTWLKRHVEKNKLRSGDEVRRVLERHVLPVWCSRPFTEIKRSDIADLLDIIEDKHGPWVADTVLSALRSVATWYAGRHDTYQPPFVRGMRRVKKEARKRDRILSDDDLRAVWKAAEASGRYGALVQLLLLTAQRRDKVATMKWSDLSPDGVWMIATEKGEKGNPGSLTLPKIALDIIAKQPRLMNNPYVFATTRGSGPINGFNKRKAAFDIACGVTGWTLHDLRRTARSLLSRAGVRPDISERVLGHVIAGVEGVYDRHRYDEEKADALGRLANLIEQIIISAPNVVAEPAGAPRLSW